MEITLEESGVKVNITASSFETAFRLKSTIERELLKSKINLMELDLEDIAGIINVLMILDSSSEVFEAMFECLKKSSYNGVGIKKDTFDTPEKWGDLYEVFFYCLKVNVFPFYKNLLSKFKKRGKEIPAVDLEPVLATV